MKTHIFSVALLILNTMAYGQIDTVKMDNEKLSEAKIAFDKYSDCPNAQKAIQQVSSKGQSNIIYIYYAAKIAECLNNYDEAIYYFEKFNEYKNDYEIDEKISELRYLLNKKISECTKCKGTGYFKVITRCENDCKLRQRYKKNSRDSEWVRYDYYFIRTNKICPKCNGEGKVKDLCYRCEGAGKVKAKKKIYSCSECDGKGYTGYKACWYNTESESIWCSMGKLVTMCKNEHVEDDSVYGKIEKVVKCDHKN